VCTLIVLDRIVPDYPVIAAANRDEFYGRPASGPQLLSPDPWIVGPRDEQAGGTWIGVGRGRLFAGLTNRPHGGERDPSRRSRGEVTLMALRSRSVRGALEALDALPSDRYNGFHLLCAGRDGAGVTAYGAEGASRRLSPGLQVLTNQGINRQGEPKVERVRALTGDARRITSVEDALDLLEGVLCDHEGEQVLERVCIHTEHYGTRSSTLLALHETDPLRAIYRHSEGAPCETPWKDASELLRSAPDWRSMGGAA
jgi:uncharacterized protein with NRDE domain